ncbi:MAG: TetR/AcrR family transcriptional regulator [Terriglobales bacterium]
MNALASAASGAAAATRGQLTRSRIVRVAGNLFRTQGYECTTVREIAAAAGLQSGSLFFHFNSKEEILMAVLEGGLRRAATVLEQSLARAGSPREALRALLHGHLQAVLVEEPDAFHVALYEWRTLSPPARQRVIALRDEYESRFGRELDRLASAGLVPRGTHLYRLFLLGALNWSLQWYRPGGALDVAALAEGFLAFLLPPAAPARRGGGK